MKAISTILLILAGFNLAQICPPAEVLHPCTCKEDLTPSINCTRIPGSFNLKGIFDNVSSFVDDDVVFDTLELSFTSLVQIHDGDIEHLKFTVVKINDNPELDYISPRAFNASRNFTRMLDLGSNRIRDGAAIFQFVSSFPNLGGVILDSNNISSIPDNAIRNLPNLGMIVLSHNRISRIGSNAFATGRSVLWSVHLDNNYIPSGGLPEDAFHGISEGLTNVYLEHNEMEFMERKSFQPLLAMARKVVVGGTTCGDGQCTAERLYCDERADWLCHILTEDPLRLRGYACKPGAGVDQLWEYCAGRNITIH